MRVEFGEERLANVHLQGWAPGRGAETEEKAPREYQFIGECRRLAYLGWNTRQPGAPLYLC